MTPDRGYGMSIRGIAREIACAYDRSSSTPPMTRNWCRPYLSRARRCRFTSSPEPASAASALRPVTGIDPNAKSPWWLRRRLLLSGIRPISPAVDVTNYVMLELGHPMHAHDQSRIHGDFAVRFADPGRPSSPSTTSNAHSIRAMCSSSTTSPSLPSAG